jgi:hypothetical protein
MDPTPDPLLRKSGSEKNQTPDLWICSQELWPLDHRGGHTWLQKCNILKSWKYSVDTLHMYLFNIYRNTDTEIIYTHYTVQM